MTVHLTAFDQTSKTTALITLKDEKNQTLAARRFSQNVRCE